MNFFEYQDQARKNTRRLIFLFIVALTGLIFLIAFLLVGMSYFFGLYSERHQAYASGQNLWELASWVFEWQYFSSIALGVVIVVGLASLFRLAQLKSGGQAIAEQLGGRLINANPRTLKEKQLLNIVEEMAIASGTPVPPVYVIDEAGINAFAAGYKLSDAVIGVTQGAIEQLARDELQGVIAHEFSHILNGDMRLNLRLIGLIYGLMVIAISGRYLLEGSRYSSKDRRATLSIGIALLLFGYLGVFFGNLIKSAISRQREFLADASAVQFTRSQEGIAGALKKIGGMTGHSVWQKHDANEVSHMLFSQGLHFRFLNRLFATHPPLDVRIKRMQPQWDGKFTPFKSEKAIFENNEKAEARRSTDGAISASQLVQALDYNSVISDKTISAATGQVANLRSHFNELLAKIHEPYTARALVYAMLLDADEAIEAEQWQDLNKNQPPVLLKQVRWVKEQLSSLNDKQPLILLDMSLPILKLLTKKQYTAFKLQLLRLIKMDKKVELREWALFYLIEYYCRTEAINTVRFVDLVQRKPAIAQLLSAVASIGATTQDEARSIFHSCVKKELGLSLRWYTLNELTIQSLTQALKQIRVLKAFDKPKFLKACIRIAENDDKIERAEYEVISCIAQALDCPLPSHIRH
jgi:Zn-dependent protease with chaperone function/tellurite resistance protein